MMKSNEKKRAVVYYSLEGNTKKAARKAASQLGADLIEVRPEKQYPTSFMKYVVGGGQTVFGMDPDIARLKLNPANYDGIYLAAPIWAGKLAAPMNSFLKRYPVADKVEGVILTSKSGETKGARKQIAKLFANARHIASLVDQSMAASKDNDEQLRKWVHDIQAEDRRTGKRKKG